MSASRVGGQRICCSCAPGSPPDGGSVELDLLELRDPRDRAHDLDPAAVHAALDAVELVERVVGVLLVPEASGDRIERHAERVSQAVGEEPPNVRTGLSPAGDAHERVVARRRAVVVQAEDGTAQMRVVRRRPAELVVGRRGRRPLRQVLHLTTAPEVADRDVQLAVGPEGKDAAVVVGACRLGGVALARRVRSSVVLEGAELQQVVVVDERGPDQLEAVDAVPAQRYPQQIGAVRPEHGGVRAHLLLGEEVPVGLSRGPARPEEVHASVGREVGVQCEPEQAPLRRGVDRKVDEDALDGSVHHPLDAAGGLLGDEEVVRDRERPWSWAGRGR